MAMDKLSKKDEKSLEKQRELDEWFEQMNRQMEWDSQFKDFSVPEEWDKDFLAAIDEAFEEEEQKRKKRKRIWSTVACLAIAVSCLGVAKRDVIGDCLKEVFVNQSEEGGSEHEYIGTEEDFSVIPDKQQDRFNFEGKTLEEVYMQIKDTVKRPMFQITDVGVEYEIAEAYYDASLELIVIVLDTIEGRIFVSQETRLDHGGTGGVHDQKNQMVWNENLQQYIVVNRSVQDDGYTFLTREGSFVFNYFGQVTYEMSCDMLPVK